MSISIGTTVFSPLKEERENIRKHLIEFYDWIHEEEMNIWKEEGIRRHEVINLISDIKLKLEQLGRSI